MSGDWEEDVCKKALVLVEELCFRSGGYSQSASCQEFSYMMRGRNGHIDTGNTVDKLVRYARDAMNILLGLR